MFGVATTHCFSPQANSHIVGDRFRPIIVADTILSFKLKQSMEEGKLF